MKKRGFKMPGKRATLSSALAFLKRKPGFTWQSVYGSKGENTLPVVVPPSKSDT